MKRNWTDEELRTEALKYKTKGEFKTNNPNAYMAAWRRVLIDDEDGICNHMVKNKYTKKEIHDAALKCRFRSEFMRRHTILYNYARNIGILTEVCSHMERMKKGESVLLNF